MPASGAKAVGGVKARRRLTALAAFVGVQLSVGSAPALADEPARLLAPRPCPGGLDTVARCFGGRDANGAHVLAAIPIKGNGTLVVHAHGGPRHVDPATNSSDPDLVRFAAMVRSGYAWASSSYRTGGYGVRQAAADVEESRRIFWQQFGQPRRTILHGQSYGGNVVAKLAEIGALDNNGRPRFDAALLTSAAVGRRIDTYDKLIDLRVVYQFYCRNLPRPDEAPYPAWLGLPRQSSMTRAELRDRVNACTGVDHPPAARAPNQARALAAILAITGEQAASLPERMELVAFRLQDVVNNFLDGANPFDNSARRYRGSGNDRALNAGIERFSGSMSARDRIGYDSDLRGDIIQPMITLHARHDPVVDYRAEAHFRNVVADAGRSHLLLQLFTSEAVHSKLSDSEYLAALSALESWLEKGQKPTLADVRRACADHAGVTGQPCLFIDMAVE